MRSRHCGDVLDELVLVLAVAAVVPLALASVDRWSPLLLRVAVLQGIDGFEGRSSLRTWTFRILLFTSRSKAERERRVPSLTDAAGSTAEER